MALTAIKKMDLGIHGKSNSIVEALLDTSAVSERAIGAGTVSTTKIATGAVTTAKIDDAAVTTIKINDSAVTTGKINDGAINNAKIATDADIAWGKMTANAEIRGTSLLKDNVTIGSSAENAKVTLNASTGDVSMGGNLTVTGDLLVQGNTTTLNTQEVLVEDKLMQVGYVGGASAPAATGFSGMSVFNGTDSESVAAAQPALVWDATASSWKFSSMTDATTLGSLQKLTAGDLVASNGTMASLDVAGALKAGADDAFTVDGTTGAVVTKSSLRAETGLMVGVAENVLMQVASNGNITTNGTVAANGNFTINPLGVSGANAFSVAASSGNTVVAGTLTAAGTLTIGDNKVTADASTGAVTAVSFSGNGASLTNLTAANVTGSHTLPDGVLSTNVMLLDGAQTVTATKTFQNCGVALVGTTSGTSSILNLTSDWAAGVMVAAQVSGDSAGRFNLQADGKMLWGAGSGATDVNLYRSAADVLKTDDKLVVGGALDAVGDFKVGADKLTVAADTGNTVVAGTLSAAGDLKVNTDKFVVTAESGNTAVAGTLAVAGASTLKGDLALKDGSDVSKFTVAAASGNTVVSGTLTVAQNSTFSKSLTVQEHLTVNGNLVVNGQVTYVNSTNLAVEDSIIHLNEPALEEDGFFAASIPAPVGYAGISIFRGTNGSKVEADHAAMVWHEAATTDASGAAGSARFKVGTLTANDNTLTLVDLEVAKIRGNGSLLTNMAASQISVDNSSSLTLASTTVQNAILELQGDIDSIMGGSGGTSLSSLQGDLNDVIADLGFITSGENKGTMAPFVTGDGVGEVTFIGGMTVRSALVKLDEEVDQAQADLTAHLNDTVGAHAASAISVDTTSGSNPVAQNTVQGALENHEGRLDTIEAKAWRQALIYSAVGTEIELAKPSGAPAIPANANTQVFIDGRKVFMSIEGEDREFAVANDGSKITFAQLTAGQTVELLYFA